jgi:hypothetical protein
MILRHTLLQRYIAEYRALNPFISTHACGTNGIAHQSQNGTYFNKVVVGEFLSSNL